MSRRFVAAVLGVATLIIIGLGQQAAPTAAAGPPALVGAIGLAHVAGQETYVSVWVAVAPGEDAQAKATGALARYGAVPVAFSTNGSWKQFSDKNATNDFVTQRYNGSAEPASLGGAGLAVLQATQSTWSAVDGSSFAFALDAGPGLACPSLLDECEGAQFFDGYNDVSWYPLADANVLGVTWFSLRGRTQEADLTLNTNFGWAWGSDDTANDVFEVETVLLHENGHVLGLGHSNVSGAVMEPYYGGVRTALAQDDIDGVLSLYGPKQGGGGNGGPPPGKGGGKPN